MKTRALLVNLGFKEDWTAMTDELPAYECDMGGLKLRAIQVMNRYLSPTFLFTAMAGTPRTLAQIRFEMPLEVESLEHGAAWIASGLGDDYEPAKSVPWLDLGRANQHTLPWVRRRLAYEKRPACFVERDWFRTAGRKLREYALEAGATETAGFSFDGEILRISLATGVLAVSATGNPWDETYFIHAAALDRLQKRFGKPMVYISIFDGRMTVDNRAWDLVAPQAADMGRAI